MIFILIYCSKCIHEFNFDHISQQTTLILSMFAIDEVEIHIGQSIITYLSDWSTIKGLELRIYAFLGGNKNEIYGPYNRADHVMGMKFDKNIKYTLRFRYDGENEARIALFLTERFYSGQDFDFPHQYYFPGFSYKEFNSFDLESNPILFDFGKQMDYLIIFVTAAFLGLYIFAFWFKFCRCICAK